MTKALSFEFRLHCPFLVTGLQSPLMQPEFLSGAFALEQALLQLRAPGLILTKTF